MELFNAVAVKRRTVLLWLIYAAILAGVLFRIFYIIDHNPVNHIWSDPERHWVQGIDAKRNDPMIMTDPVMYQLYIAALSKLTFSDPGLVAFYTILLCLLAPWVWYRFLRELQPSRTAALTGALVLIWLPSWLSIYSYFMQETLLLPLLGLALWMTWRCWRKQTLNSFLIMVLVWALAGLTRGICIPMAAVATIWLWLQQSQKISKATYTVVLLSVVLAPLSIRSLQHMGIWAPHGIGQMAMIYAKSGMKEIKMTFRRHGSVWRYGFMSPALLEPPFAPLSDWTSERTGKVVVHIDIDKGYEDWERNLENNSLTPGKYLSITKENLILLFFSESWPDSERSYVVGNLNYWMRWIWAPMAVAVLVASAMLLRRQRQYWLLPSIILVWFIVQGLLPIAVNEGRYRKPFEGLLIAQIVLLAGVFRQRREELAHPLPDAQPDIAESTAVNTGNTSQDVGPEWYPSA